MGLSTSRTLLPAPYSYNEHTQTVIGSMARGFLPVAMLAASLIIVAVLSYTLPSNYTPQWRIAEVMSSDTPVYVFHEHSSYIENIYAIRHDWNYDKYSCLDQYAGNENLFDVAIESDPALTVPYEVPFDFVVSLRADAENDVNKNSQYYPLAYARKENVKVQLQITGFASYLENSTDLMEYVFENYNYGQTTGYIRVNVVFDNNGNGWTMPAGGSLNYSVTYYLWG